MHPSAMAFACSALTAEDVAAPWFRETAAGPMALMGEDLTFCPRRRGFRSTSTRA
jgi:hypothetical protein